MKYFISFVSVDEATGNCIINRDSPICEYPDIKDIEESIRNQFNCKRIIITNWKRMELPE